MFSGFLSNGFPNLFRHHQLLKEMVKRDILDRYSGHAFQIFWTFFQPMLTIGVQIFVFSFIFKGNVSGQENFPFPYPAYILSGLIPWYYFQEAMSRGCHSITANANIVKQVVFPVEVLPLTTTASGLIIQTIALTFFLTYLLIAFQKVSLFLFLLPVACFFQFLFLAGINFFLSSVNPYFRDVKEVVQVFLTISIYLLPIIYLPHMVPRFFSLALFFNPFSHMIWVFQDVLFFGSFTHSWSWIIFGIESVVLFSLGFRMFERLKIMFGNVL